MPRSPSLPRYRDATWRGGFVIEAPVYTASIAARDGTVVAATECIYRMRAGDTHLQAHPLLPGFGDVVAVAVEPRPAGRSARFALATQREVHMFHDDGASTVPFPEDHGEIFDMKWLPRIVDGAVTECLHVFFPDRRLALAPDGSHLGTFVDSPWPTSERLDAMTTDGAGGLAFVTYNDEYGDIDVSFALDFVANEWGSRPCPTPNCYWGAKLAVAGNAVAVSFIGGGVWLTRNIKEDEFVELEAFRRVPSLEGVDGTSAIAFEGASADAALFAVVRETKARSAIVRVDVAGRHEKIAELEMETEAGDLEEVPLAGLPMIRAIAWDETRRTLWSAAGRAGVMCSTAPGAPLVFGEEGAKQAPS